MDVSIKIKQQKDKNKKGKEQTMKGIRFLDRRLGFSLGAALVTLGMVVPAVLPAFASADQLTNRSVTMSSSNTSATGVQYDIKFDATATGAGDVVLLFCDASTGSIFGTQCSAPTGFGLSSATVDGTASSGTATKVQSSNTNTMVVGMTIASTGNEIVLDNVANPSSTDPYYLRIETFASGNSTNDTTNSKAAESTAPVGETTTGYSDEGGVAMQDSSNIGVNAYVEESMTFCVSGEDTAPGHACGANGQAVDTNVGMQLGETQGTQKVLESSAISTATDYVQLSTNAVSGAVVNLKSSAAGCGGLVRSYGAANCDIKPATTGGITAGQALFGITVGAQEDATGTNANPSGTLAADSANGYNASTYHLDYQSGDTAGVTSPYGSGIITSSGPVSDENVPVTFGASVSNLTPAGIYGATMNMVAVGTF